MLWKHMHDLTSCRYNLGELAALTLIVDNLLRPVDWYATQQIFKTILKDTHALLNSIACIEQVVLLKSVIFKVRVRGAHRLIGRLRCTCALFQRLLVVY